MNWVLFCKRTEDPKLAWIESELDKLGIAHRRNGESSHGPILEDGSLKYADGSGRAPFCRLTEATGQRYESAEWFVRDLRDRVHVMQEQAKHRRETAPMAPQDGKLRGIDHFHRQEPDGSRADRRYAVYARDHGVPETEIAAAIIQYRDLSHHREGPVKYAERTIRGAEKYLGMGL